MKRIILLIVILAFTSVSTFASDKKFGIGFSAGSLTGLSMKYWTAKNEAIEIEFEGLKYYEVMNATMVDYSGGRNIIPEEFVINVNYRFAPGKTIEEAKEDILRLVDREAEVEFTDLCPSGSVCLYNPILGEFIDNFNLPVEAKQAWTDVARLSLYGIDAVNFGPGDPAQAHQKNEYIPISNLIKSFNYFKTFMER